ncbi:PadR family transcriptional regulator [Subtercola lobariae]|uniref:Transcription regulator PadR N-terminal domain-containing protein n=1 Tax=Subtercola lobariae TaxID=1588641 RepID=A0A917B543_9MICO|nr:PadR family transcriptional regulator [Subtercola lobariae]GGF24570.1 hypothetical protein GCM10011399_17580 [Subtercola lobariae]
MSVRASILAILTLGSGYGLQVHAEIENRTARAGEINVGQIYSTLARLKTAGLVQVRSATSDGLPLYELTPDGRAEAEHWLTSVDPTTGPAWSDMVNHLLLASSLPSAELSALVSGYRALWLDAAAARVTRAAQAEELRAAANRAVAEAALAWLAHFETREVAPLDYTMARPRRGRRPASTLVLN